MRSRLDRALSLPALLLFASACRSPESRAREAEGARVSRAIDGLRDAPNVAKKPLLSALEHEPCRDPAVCELKALCVRGYRRHVESLEAGERARALLASPTGGDDAALAAASAVNQAEAALSEAQSLTQACAASQGALRRQLKP